MPMYSIRMTQRTVWEFELEADSPEHAELLTQEWGRDELDEDEIVSNSWEVEVS